MITLTIPLWLAFILALALVYLTMWLTVGFVTWAERRDELRKEGDDPDDHFPFNWRLLIGPLVYWNWIIRRLQAENAQIDADTAALIAERERRNGG